jgi:methionyl-tRNA formyltransferase
MTYIVAESRQWRPDMLANLEHRTGKRFHAIVSPAELTAENLSSLRAERVFFPHWSHRIPDSVFDAFDCVIFHMTDVPFGRGGSPLQNLIARGIYDTRISALKCTASLDAGPVYLRRPLSLEGSAEDIYKRAAEVIEDMIVDMVLTSPAPVAQQGEPVIFKRRTPADGNIASLTNLQTVYDYIRMLDAPGYPNAFLEAGNVRLEFRKAQLLGDSVTAEVVIRRKS